MQRCPECDEKIKATEINLREGVALCSQCGALSKLSELSNRRQSIDQVLSNPPSGCGVEPTVQGVLITASLRSMVGFLGMTAIGLFWNGITALFVSIALAGLYANLIGPVPEWFPAPGVENGQPIMNDAPMDLGDTLFLCAFLTPFVIIGTVMAGAAVIYLAGRVQVQIDEMDSWIATGIGFVSWQRRFDPLQVHDVRLADSRWKSDGNNSRTIELAGDTSVTLGSTLPADRQEWLQIVLREILLKSGGAVPQSNLTDLTWIQRNRQLTS